MEATRHLRSAPVLLLSVIAWIDGNTPLFRRFIISAISLASAPAKSMQRRGSLRPLDGSHLREESCGDELNDFGELRVRNFGNCVRDGKRDYRTRW